MGIDNFIVHTKTNYNMKNKLLGNKGIRDCRRTILNNCKAIVLLVFLSVSMISSGQSNKDIPIEFQDYVINKSTKVEYKKVYPQTVEEMLNYKFAPCPDSISKEQAFEDIEQFEYLLETAFSGREYWEKQGCDFNKIYSKLNDFVDNKETICVLDLENYMSSLLKGKTAISHFSIRGHKYHGFEGHKSIYFTDILLNKNKKGKFIVIDSKVDSVPVGSELDDNEINEHVFPTLSPKGKEHYLVGIWSYDKVTNKALSFNGKYVNIPFHPTRLKQAKFNKSPLFKVDTIDNIPVIRLATFMPPKDNLPLLESFEEYGKKLRNEEKFILNICNNDGGSAIHAMNFIRNLNTVIFNESMSAYMYSPSLSQMYAQVVINDYPQIFKQPGVEEYTKQVIKHQQLLDKFKMTPQKEWDFAITNTSDDGEGTYDGKMIILMNRKTESAAEYAVHYSKSVKNIVLVGENTYGAGVFTPGMKYYLPNSKICMQIPHEINIIPGFRESVGFVPDYWLDTNKPVEEIIKWLNNPETYQFRFSDNDN